MIRKRTALLAPNVEFLLKNELFERGERLMAQIETKIDSAENRLDARIETLEMKMCSMERTATARNGDVDKRLEKRIESGAESLKDYSERCTRLLHARIDGVEKCLDTKMNGTARLLDTKITESASRLDEKIFGMDLRLSLKIEERFNQVSEMF